ncbi:tetratricopeptide repeat protein [Aquisphaera insulae]|uniref:tetratricopeptide repeat protein n=1 Tax=Aquisphaera insulae TaxID=2712864 RepID=UPI0013EBDFAB|nr:tetratricopeptide repeat protein [Aquisphaera insulae]
MPLADRESPPRPRLVPVVALALLPILGVALTGYRLLRPAPDPDRLWAQSERAFLSGHHAEARKGLDRLRHLRQPTPRDLMLEAQLALAEDHPRAGRDALARIADDQPLAAQARLLEGRLSRQEKRLRDAEASFLHALRIDPRQVEARKELVYIYGIQLRRNEVDAQFRALAALTPLTHHDLFAWALTHYTTWRPEIADELQGYIDADPSDRASRLALCEYLIDQPGREGQVEKAVQGLPADDPDALAVRIALALNKGDLDRALALLVNAPEDHPRIARMRGQLAMKRRDVDTAIRCFTTALTAEPYDRISPMELAQACRLKADEAAATRYLDRVRRLNDVFGLVMKIRSPEQVSRPADLLPVARACEAAGLTDEARGWYSLVIAASPLDSEAQQALARLPRPAPVSGSAAPLTSGSR